ncbi:hypothetical protein ACFWBI_07885 [Streptomyces sp. NPDC059982]|uniref:hypothetical protein n=1 Tax=unclassified Streptomyces TaxID=2593676 RepID=UPI00369CA30A
MIEAKPVYDSHPRDITCAECGATAVFDLTTARTRARAVTEGYEAAGTLTRNEASDLRETAVKTISPVAFVRRRAGDSWNAISTNFLMNSGAATDKDSSAVFVGKVGLAVIDGLEESEYAGEY